MARAVAMAQTFYRLRRAHDRFSRWRRSPLALAPLADVYPDAAVTAVRAGETVATPELVHMRLHEDWWHVPRPQITTPDSWVAEIDDAVVDMARNVVVGRSGREIVVESVGYPEFHNARLWPPEIGTYDRPRVRVPGVSTTFRCFVHHRNHYHAMVDGLPRLHSLMTDARFADRPINVLVDDTLGAAERLFLDELLPEHMAPLQVPGDAVLETETLLLPSYITVANVGVLPSYYREWLVPRLVPDRLSSRAERIYIPRGDAGTRRVANEGELIDALADRGFRQWHLGELSLREQAALFHDAEIVVGGHGAGLTNLLFAQRCGVVELFNSPFVRPHYYYMAKAQGHRWRHVLSDRMSKDADFEIDVARVAAHVDRLIDGPAPARR